MLVSSQVPATTLFWQPRPGQTALVVVVKVTFALEGGVSALAPSHDPLVEQDQHWDDDPSRFLVAASDLAPAKARVDVLYVGRSLVAGPARLRVGPLDKVLEARGGWPGLGPLGADRRGAPEATAWAARWTSAPMPAGVGAQVFNVAPPDQQLDELPPGASILLDNLAPGTPHLASALPLVAPKVEVDLGVGAQRLAMRADTVSIDGERAVVSVVWRGQLGVEHASQVRAVAVELGEADAAPLTRAPARTPSRTAAVAEATGRALPFRSGTGAALPASRPVARAPQVQSGHTFVPGLAATALPNLPSHPAASAPPPPAPPPPAPAAPPPPPPVAYPAAAPAAPPAAPPPPPPRAAPISAATPGWGGAYAPAGAGVGPVSASAPAPHHASTAARGGLTAASDAAADAAPQPMGARTRARRPSSGLRVLWFDPDSVLRIRRRPAWRTILTQRERRPAERDDALAAADAEDAGEMLAILAEGTGAHEGQVGEALSLGFDDDGGFTAELARVDGELALELDDVAVLAALLATATPSAPEDDALARAVEAAGAFLRAPGNVSPAAIARGLGDQLRRAWGGWKGHPFDAAKLDELASRAVLEQRAFLTKDLFGGPHVRAALHLAGSATPLPTYLPEGVAKKLPLYLRLPVRTIAEVHPREDETEESGAALRVLAIARVLGEG